MKYDLFEIPAAPLEAGLLPSVTGLEVQGDGTLLCGLSFANPLLLKITPKGSGKPEIEDLGVEDYVAGGFAIVRGLRGTTTGDTALVVLQDGLLPAWVRGLVGSEWRRKEGVERAQFLRLQEGGLGAHLRHSILQIVGGELRVRHAKAPGALLDVAHIGDFVFGVSESEFWREPYLNAEKRETVRSDLEDNRQLHRDGDGNFWFRGEGGRALRAGQTDIKATPTTLRIKGESFSASADSPVDGFCYGVTAEGKQLFRVRRNRISKVEEMQMIGDFSGEVTALACVDHPENPYLLIVESDTPQGVAIHRLELRRLGEDEEDLPAPGNLTRVGDLREFSSASTLTVDARDPAKITAYVGEGRLEGRKGNPSPRLAILSL